MLRKLRYWLSCAYIRVLENVEGIRTPHSDAPAKRYAMLRFKKDAAIVAILKRTLWHFDTPFTVLDVGAEIGYYSIIASKWARTQATIYSFEPNASFYELLECNAKKHPGIHPQAAALYDHNDPSNTTPVITGDAFVKGQKLERVDIIKVNTGAASLETLKGLSHTFDAASKIMLMFEFRTQNLRIASHTVRDLYETLIGLGLELHSIDPGSDQMHVVLLKDAEHLADLEPAHLIGFKGYTKREMGIILGCIDPNAPTEN